MFCSTNGGDGPCDHANYVNRFNLIYMVPCRLEDARDEVEDDNTFIGNDHEMLAMSLNVGEHFTIIATKDNLEGDDFWVFICEETLAMVEKFSKVDCWGAKVFRGEQIVVGKYYKK